LTRAFSKIIEYDTAHIGFNYLGTHLEEFLVVHEDQLIKMMTQHIVNNVNRMIQNRQKKIENQMKRKSRKSRKKKSRKKKKNRKKILIGEIFI
jgi:hypothetical protein